MVHSAIIKRLMGADMLWLLASTLCPHQNTPLVIVRDQFEVFVKQYASSAMFTYACVKAYQDYISQVTHVWPILSVMYSVLIDKGAKYLYKLMGWASGRHYSMNDHSIDF